MNWERLEHLALIQRVLAWLATIPPSSPSSWDAVNYQDPYGHTTFSNELSPCSSFSSYNEPEYFQHALPSFLPKCYSPLELDDEDDDESFFRRNDSEAFNIPEFSAFYAPDPLASLPHRESNPLITICPEMIEEEFCRVLKIRNSLQASQDELLFQHSLEVKCRHWEMHDWTVGQQIFESSLAVQRANDAAQYILEHSHAHGIGIDFLALSLQYCHPSLYQQNLCPPSVQIYDGSPDSLLPAVDGCDYSFACASRNWDCHDVFEWPSNKCLEC